VVVARVTGWQKPEMMTMDARDWQAELAHAAKCPVRLVFTRNRVTLASARPSPGGGWVVRVHESFHQAPESVWSALGSFLGMHRRKDWQVVSAYARTIAAPACGRAVRGLSAEGRTYHLGHLAQEVNHRFFGGQLHDFQIGWGRRAAAKRRRGCRSRVVRFGSWCGMTRCIRVHPMLDQPDVAADFVRYIVFHEMLHASLAAGRAARRRVHDAEFRRMERMFPGCAAWREYGTRLVHQFI
jgi:hypothetical protein